MKFQRLEHPTVPLEKNICVAKTPMPVPIFVISKFHACKASLLHYISFVDLFMNDSHNNNTYFDFETLILAKRTKLFFLIINNNE